STGSGPIVPSALRASSGCTAASATRAAPIRWPSVSSPRAVAERVAASGRGTPTRLGYHGWSADPGRIRENRPLTGVDILILSASGGQILEEVCHAIQDVGPGCGDGPVRSRPLCTGQRGEV